MPCLIIRKVQHIETAVILFLMCRNTLLSLFIFTLSVCESNNTIISPSRLLRSHNHAKYFVFSTRYKMISNQLVAYVLIELQKKHQGSRLKNLIKPGMCTTWWQFPCYLHFLVYHAIMAVNNECTCVDPSNRDNAYFPHSFWGLSPIRKEWRESRVDTKALPNW